MEDLLSCEQDRDRRTPVEPELLASVEQWFSEVVFSDEQGKRYLVGVETSAKAEGGVPFFAKLMASLTASLRVEADTGSQLSAL